MRSSRSVILALPVLLLGGCSGMDNTQQRLLSGGAIGAGAGAVVGALTGGLGIAGGAAIRAAAGAAGGLIVDQLAD